MWFNMLPRYSPIALKGFIKIGPASPWPDGLELAGVINIAAKAARELESHNMRDLLWTRL